MSNPNDDLNPPDNADHPDDPNNPSVPGQSSDPDDFANFDPARYLEKRGIKTGRYTGDPRVDREAESLSHQYGEDRGRGARRRRGEEGFSGAEGAPVGLFGNIGRALARGEGLHM